MLGNRVESIVFFIDERESASSDITATTWIKGFAPETYGATCGIALWLCVT